MLQVSELYVYPIKSLGGIAVSNALVTDRGFQYDRRWMLVDQNNGFMTQREFAQMALLRTEILEEGLKVFQKQKEASILIPFETKGQTIMVQVWSDRCKAVVVDKKVIIAG